MGLHSSGAQPTRLAGIQVQTSSLGVQIPIVWGTARLKCNLIWYANFKAKAQKTGKGGSVTTGYSYTADLILAICEGPIASIKTVWVDSKQFTNGAKTALQQAGLSMATGALGQAVWSYLASNYPNQALGYSGLCIAYAASYPLGSGAGTPQHNFEVVSNFTGGTANVDANPKDVLTDFFTNGRYGLPLWGAGLLDATSFATYSTYCLAANLLLSPVIDQARQASDFLQEIMTATNSNLLWSEGLLKIVVYGDTAATGNGATFTPNLTPVYALTDDQFIPKQDGEDPIFVDLEDQSDAYNTVRVEFLDRSNQYSSAIATATDSANVSQYGRRIQDPTSLHCICDATVAQNAAQLLLQRTLYVRKQYKFTLDWRFALLEPGDLVTLTHPELGLAAYAVRIIQIDEDEDGLLEITAEDFLVGVSHTPQYTLQQGLGYQANQGVDPGSVEANLLIWSEDLTQSAWSKTNCTIGGASLTGPDGSTINKNLITSSAAGTVTLLQQVTAGALPGRNLVFSMWLQEGTFPGTVTVRVQSSNGATLVDTVVSPHVPTGVWTRYSAAIAMGASADTVVNVVITFTATAANQTLWAWGAQLTEGLDLRDYAKSGSALNGPLIFNPPAVLTPAGIETWAAVNGGANWGGANVWLSIDNSNYELVGTITTGSRYGRSTASFASHADPDTTDTLSLDLGPSASSGALTSATNATADNGGTLSLLGSELICFSTVSLTGTDRYNLTTYIRRGYLNTPIAAHSADEPFVRLDGAPFQIPYFTTNINQTVYAKFQSFNLWGLAAQDLSVCRAYSFLPFPQQPASPGASAWTAVGGQVSNAGQSLPAILITGASDNGSAQAIEFDYRVNGTSQWLPGAFVSNQTTSLNITQGIAAQQKYDVSVVYIVNGVPSVRTIIATGITVGSVSTGAKAGDTIVNASATGAGQTVTLPAGSYTHVDIVLTGFPGAGNGTQSGGGGGGGKGGGGTTDVDVGGGGAGVVVVKGFPVTAGSTVLTFTIPSAVGNDATCTATGLSLTAHAGTNATTTTAGTGAAASTGNTATGATSVTAYAGHNGALTDTWDGGGAADINGTYHDNTTDPSVGSLPGQAGVGTPFTQNAGGGANLLVIARA